MKNKQFLKTLYLLGLLGGSRLALAADLPSLEATYWRLVSFGDETLVISNDDPPPHIALHSETNRIAGFGGCNRFFGRYRIDGAVIKIEPLGGGRASCERTNALEQRFITVLGSATVYRIDTEHLYLGDAQATSLVFRAIVP